MSDESAQNQGIKSLDSALRVLAHLSEQSGPSSLSDIARECGMPPSKVHRYLATFSHAGLVQQEGRSGRYDLGPAAMQLGLAAIARHDFVNHAADGLADLSADTGMTVLLSVWGNEGATVVRWERGVSPTVTSMGLGTTLPLLNSATGRAFLAWAPQAPLRRSRDFELRRAARTPRLVSDIEPTKSGLAALVARTRERGYAFVRGDFIPGLIAAAAPILDWQAEAQAVITLVGTDPAAIEPGAKEVMMLVAFCEERSASLTPQTSVSK